jgi:hypothetical protein
MNKVKQLVKLLRHKPLKASRVEYLCEDANDEFILFAESDTTGRIMIPTDLALEWIQAFEFGLIDLNERSRLMRKKVARTSRWASFQHGFETHLAAIVRAWSEKYPSTRSSKKSK